MRYEAIVDIDRRSCEVVVCGIQPLFQGVESVVAMEVLDSAYGVFVQRVLGRLVGGEGGGSCPLSIRHSGWARSG